MPCFRCAGPIYFYSNGSVLQVCTTGHPSCHSLNGEVPFAHTGSTKPQKFASQITSKTLISSQKKAGYHLTKTSVK